MRPAGFTLAAVLIGVTTVASGQPPAVPGTPVAPKAPPALPVADPKLDAHLTAWEKTMTALTSFHFELSLKRTEVTYKSERSYSGVVLCMKPNYAVLRLNYAGDKDKKEQDRKEKDRQDYEAYICNGKAVFAYNGLERSITEFPIPDPATNAGGVTDNLMIDFLSGMKSKDAKARFDISLFQEDPKNFYIYLDVKPVLAKDKAEFQQMRMALYGSATQWPYLPAQVYLVKPNGDTEQWSFKEPKTNIPGLTAKDFSFQKVEGFTLQKAPPARPAPPAVRPGMPMLPGGTNLPPGPGNVRP